MTIQEKNKLIAEFLGHKDVKIVSHYDTKKYPNGLVAYCEEGCYSHYFNFENNWIQLMSVIDKIESLELNIPHSYSYSIGSFEQNIPSGTRSTDMIVRNVFFKTTKEEVRLVFSDNGCTTDELYSKGSKIENTYNASIEFIRWYNQNLGFV